MDPRLKRWALVTLGGVVLAAVLLLLPGGDPIMGLPWAWDPWRGLSPLAVRQQAVEQALVSTKYKLAALRRRRAVEAVSSNRRDPLVIASSASMASEVQRVQRIADAIWSSLPKRGGGTRTILDVASSDVQWVGEPASDNDGNCVVGVGSDWGGETMPDVVRNFSGECLFLEVFGAPGTSWRRWQGSIPQDRLVWPGGRLTRFERMIAEEPETRPRAWFEIDGAMLMMLSPVYRAQSSPLRLAFLACSGGRADQCQQAYQVDTGAVLKAEYGDAYRAAPTWKLPAALLTDLGPAKFAELWRTDLPISTAYAQLSGRSIDQILRDVTMQAWGPRFRETPLPLLSWFGLVVWAGLLLLWARERIRTRVAG